MHLRTRPHTSIRALFRASPTRFGPLLGFTAAVMDADSQLTRAEREEIALFTSAINHCGYCIGDHSAVLENLGLSAERIAAAAEGSTAKTSEQMRPLLGFLAKLTRTPGAMVQADTDAVSAAGWSDQAIEDAICICSLFNLFNRLLRGLGIEGTPESFAEAGKELSTGYGPPEPG